MFRLITCLAALLLIAVGPALAQSEGDRERQVITDLLGDEPVSEEQFTSAFLAQVPLAQVEQLLTEVRSTIGRPNAVVDTEDGYLVRSPTHTMPVEISLDAEGRIARLVFRPPVQRNTSIAEIAVQFEELEGSVSYYVTRGEEVLAASHADEPLAVGSAFKLGVLGVVKDAIAAGELTWDQVLTLEQRHISLPTGILQTFPPGSPVTVQTAAALMISISDNTATDLLIDTVGRDAVAERLGIDFALTTREFFYLKGDIETREAYLSADREGKAEIVATLENRPMPALNPNLPLHEAGVEWYVSAERLCTLIRDVADLEIMGINPGVANAGDWASVAYKGGSETGVLNMTTLLVDTDGTENCAVLTINATQPIQATTPTSIYASILAALAPQESE